mgnify:CR=1 FL=1
MGNITNVGFDTRTDGVFYKWSCVHSVPCMQQKSDDNKKRSTTKHSISRPPNNRHSSVRFCIDRFEFFEFFEFFQFFQFFQCCTLIRRTTDLQSEIFIAFVKEWTVDVFESIETETSNSNKCYSSIFHSGIASSNAINKWWQKLPTSTKVGATPTS